MKSSRGFILAALMFLVCELSFSQEIWTIGPMLHINFGGEKRTTSFSIEAAYWNLNNFYHSVDFAMEFTRGQVLFYTEAQTGIGLTGISFGPVVQINKRGGGIKLGVQGSCWFNYFLGVDYRMRFIDHKKLQYIGVYAKLPVAANGLDSSGSSSSWDDWDGWD